MAILCYPVLPGRATKDEYQNPLIISDLSLVLTVVYYYLTIWAGLPAMMLPTKAL